jgi:hypothetical protein
MALGARCTMKSESLSAFCDLSRHGKWLFWLAAFSACSDISLCPLPHGHRALRTARARESECCDMAYYDWLWLYADRRAVPSSSTTPGKSRAQPLSDTARCCSSARLACGRARRSWRVS